MLDQETIRHIADALDLESHERQAEADHARAGTGPFEHLSDCPAPPGVNLAVIATVNDMLANYSATLAHKIRDVA